MLLFLCALCCTPCFGFLPHSFVSLQSMHPPLPHRQRPRSKCSPSPPSWIKTADFFFLPPTLIFLQATCMREQCTAGCIFLFLLLPVGIGTLRNSPRDISCDFCELSLTVWFPFSFTCEWGGAACLVIKRILDCSATHFFDPT